ncbi:hypothetical protein [Metabacillus lacus]|uniref:hypothetical protein n=1 Tax=Metabacillus lacus TaxID=1983721 RepID=UPI001FE8AAAA|nr:hypothetical protein [Metabacillus lacus]
MSSEEVIRSADDASRQLGLTPSETLEQMHKELMDGKKEGDILAKNTNAPTEEGMVMLGGSAGEKYIPMHILHTITMGTSESKPRLMK